ncbi:E3 ubiquitin-protein ligase DCST1 isoform X2 [Hyla sarda]|uniref:E3 ubiquitin-protein ligase DCST1 isoform X2 n=1 Tax=Hyla sarda TaxID=327740 RepID=UPI0024C2FC03|nr:E3 ubiquitin-protein ligase DCST1 isoform X2 [Hyla sarda]
MLQSDITVVSLSSRTSTVSSLQQVPDLPLHVKFPVTLHVSNALKRTCAPILPGLCFVFLFSDKKEFKFSKLFLGATIGSILGLGFHFLLVQPLNLQEEQKINIMYGVSGTFAFGWAISSYFRCSTVLLISNLLGKEGRTFLTIALMASISAGPVGNMQRNFEEIAKSLSCTVGQQINYTKIIWKHRTQPLRKILTDLVGVSKEITNRSSNLLSLFKNMDSEVESTEGYNKEKEEELLKQQNIKSTQKKVELKTMLRCEYVVDLGINKCKDWFAQKHEECMRAIWLPVLNSLLCLPMKLSVFCNVMYLVNKWCKNRLPMGGNFGPAYDLLNTSINSLGKDFTATMVMRKEEQNTLFGTNISQLSMTEEVVETLKKKHVWVLRKMAYIHTIMSCMFIFLFISVFSYTIKYNTNISFDNFYITTYFRQIDARRKELNKKHLLPMPKVQKEECVFPWNFCVQKLEIRSMMMEVLQCTPFIVVFFLTMGIDRLFIHSFQFIHRHFNVTYILPINRKLHIVVGGDTFLARLLRHTVEAFNSTPSALELGNNQICLPNPSIMSFTQHLETTGLTVLLLALCLCQIYANRLRRVIASFFFPKREKCRTLYLYNHHLLKKRFYFNKIRWKTMMKCKNRQIWEKSFWGKFHKNCRWTRFMFSWRCFVCGARRTKNSYECPECSTVYCYQCWSDLNETCWACVPYKQYKMKSGNDIYDMI